MDSEKIKIVHFSRGRVRLKAEPLKDEPGLAKEVEGVFKSIPGVLGVEVNTVTGSVLFSYDPRAIRSDAAFAALSSALLRYFPALDMSLVTDWLRGSAG
jgi:hypothetical protein